MHAHCNIEPINLMATTTTTVQSQNKIVDHAQRTVGCTPILLHAARASAALHRYRSCSPSLSLKPSLMFMHTTCTQSCMCIHLELHYDNSLVQVYREKSSTLDFIKHEFVVSQTVVRGFFIISCLLGCLPRHLSDTRNSVPCTQ